MRPFGIMKKAVACSVTFCLATMTIPACVFAAESGSQTFVEEGITYTIISDTEVSVGAQDSAGTSFAGSGDIVIPESVNGYTVKSINKYAFSDGSKNSAEVTSVTIPATVTSVGAYAFYGCTSLKTVQIEKGAPSLDISKYAFYGCKNVSELELPPTLTYIGMFAFSNWESLSSLTFAQDPSNTLKFSCGEGAFFMSSTMNPQLTKVDLPPNLNAVGVSMFENHKALKTVSCSAKSLTNIGVNAFSSCKSLEYLEIPKLTGSSSKIGSGAFSYVNALKTIVFTGDIDFSMSDSTFTSSELPSAGTTGTKYSYPDVETIVYCGTHISNIYANANHYLTMTYYASAEDAEAGENPVGYARVRSDVSASDLVKGTIAESDEKGPLIYEGSIPEIEKGQVWHYQNLDLAATPSDSTSAFAVADNDLAFAQINLDVSEFSYNEKPVSLSYSLVSPTCTVLKEGVDYTTSVAVANESEDEDTGADAEEVILPIDAVSELGEYKLIATAKSADYTGSCSAPFTIKRAACSWTRMSGNASNATLNHMAEAAFKAGTLDTIVLVSERAQSWGSCVSGLAGARNALVLITKDDGLTTEARYSLNLYEPESVFLVGFSDAPAIAKSVENTMDSSVTVSSPFAADTPAEVSYNLYNKTKSKGYWDESSTAIVVSTSDTALMGCAGAYAYATSSPIFLADNNAIFGKAAEAIAAKFAKVVIVGSASSAIESQLKAAGFSGDTERWGSGSDLYAASVDIAQKAMSEGVLSCQKLALASASDTSSLVTSATICGANKSLLLLAEDNQKAAVDKIINPNRYDISTAYILGTRNYLSDPFLESIQIIWETQESENLRCATVKLSSASKEYDGKAPDEVTVTVVAADGTELVKTENFTVSVYNNATDRATSLAKMTAVGTYTFTVKGVDPYYGSASAVYTIEPIAISKASVKLTPNSATYNGKAQTPAVTVKMGTETLTSGKDYTASFSGNVNAGTAKVTITGKGNFEGTASATFTIAKAKTDMTAKAKKATFKKNKKKAQTTKITVSKAQGKVTYKSSKKAVSVSSSGKVTIKKGFKGTAKITVKCAGSANYANATKTVTIKVT